MEETKHNFNDKSKDKFNDKFNLYIEKMKKNMYIFEITKCCGFSEFITIYKNETMLDFFSKISHHFGEIEIKDLFFYTLQAEYIKVPLSNKKISEFVKENISCNPPKLISIYPYTNHNVYNIYLDDGICNCNGNCKCNNCNYNNNNGDY
jgi:hypothetical protein